MEHLMGINSIILTEEQERIVARIDDFMASSRQCFLFHGVAGTGKTTPLAHTALEFEHASLCTLTGKGASILRRKTELPAQAIHSFFYKLSKLPRTRPASRFSNSSRCIVAGSFGATSY
jgi:hypothetical protein